MVKARLFSANGPDLLVLDIPDQQDFTVDTAFYLSAKREEIVINDGSLAHIDEWSVSF